MTETRDITIEYFAQFREQAGKSTEKMTIDIADTSALYQQLVAAYGFELPQEDVKVAVNDEFVSWEYQLKNGDSIVFIPPVAGG